MTPSSSEQLVHEAQDCLRKIARSVARAQGVCDEDDLFQLGMEEACRRAPEYEPARGKTFVNFISSYARGVMLDACIREATERARAHRMQATAPLVLGNLDGGDPFEESADQRDDGRHAVAAAAVLSLFTKPQDPEELLIIHDERAALHALVDPVFDRLGDADRRLVDECAIEERSVADVARELQLKYDNARYRFKTAMAALRERVVRG